MTTAGTTHRRPLETRVASLCWSRGEHRDLLLAWCRSELGMRWDLRVEPATDELAQMVPVIITHDPANHVLAQLVWG